MNNEELTPAYYTEKDPDNHNETKECVDNLELIAEVAAADRRAPVVCTACFITDVNGTSL